MASAIVFFVVAMAVPVMAENDHQRGDMPDENSFFWEIFSQKTRPDDVSGCNAALDSYIANNPEEFGGPDVEQIRSEMSQMCSGIAEMPSDMQSDMSSNGIASSLFDANNTNWHSINGFESRI